MYIYFNRIMLTADKILFLDGNEVTLASVVIYSVSIVNVGEL